VARTFVLQSSAEELEDLAGNAMKCRAVAAAWISLFSAVDLPAWNRLSVTAEDVVPLQKSGW